MSPLKVLVSWFTTRGPRGLSSSIAVFGMMAFAILIPSRAWAQSGQCISSRAEMEMDGHTYTVITIDSYEAQSNPRGCSIYAVRFILPIKHPETGAALGPYEYGRAVYAANQNWLKHVSRQCAPTHDRQPPSDATEEERQACPHGRANYVAAPSNGWKAKIRIPTKPVKTWAETQQTAAQAACAEAKGVAAQQKCRDAGQPVGTALDATLPTPEQKEVISRLQQDLTAANTKVTEMTKRIAGFDQEISAAKSQAKADIHPYFWHWIIGLVCMLGLAIGVEEHRIKGYKERADADGQAVKPSDPTMPPSVGTLRVQLQEADERVAVLEADLAVTQGAAQIQSEKDNAEIKALRAERDELKGKLEAKNQETTDLREELARKNREVLDKDTGRDEAIKVAVEAAVVKALKDGEAIHASTESDNAHLREDIKNLRRENAQLVRAGEEKDGELLARQTEIERLAGELGSHAEDEPTVAETGTATDPVAVNASLRAEIDSLRQVIADLQHQLALDAAKASAISTPSAVTSPTPSAVTSPPEDLDSTPDNNPPTLRGFPSTATAEERAARAEAEQQRVLESDAFRHGLPELLRLLEGNHAVLEGLEPAAAMLQAIRLATERGQELDGLRLLSAQAKTQSAVAEPQASTDTDEVARLNETLRRASQAKAEAISRLTILQRVIDQMHDQGTEPERKALDALFKLAKLEDELAVLRVSLRLEGKSGDTPVPAATPVVPVEDDPVVEVSGTLPPYQGNPRTPYPRTLPPPPPKPTGSDGST